MFFTSKFSLMSENAFLKAQLDSSKQEVQRYKQSNEVLTNELLTFRTIKRYGQDWETPQGLLNIKESLESKQKELLEKEAKLNASLELQKSAIQTEQIKIECLKEQVKLLKELIKK